MGFFDFLGFGKKEKPNLTPNFRALPHATDAPLFGTLQDFARKRISGETTGFGSDYVSRASNPIIANREAQFREVTMPRINSELSKRGIARSAGSNLATDIINTEERRKNRDIDEIMANFYQLNEAQKKTDEAQGVQLGDQLNSQYLNQENNAANAENQMQENLTNRTVAQSNQRNAEQSQRQNMVIQSMGLLAGGPTGSAVLGKIFGPQAGQAMSQGAKSMTGQDATTQNVLNGLNSATADKLAKLLASL